jgi:putative oxidoreductase
MTYLFLLGRILFGGFFVISGYNHFRHHSNMTQYALSKKVPMASLAVWMSGALILLSGLSIILGIYPTLGLWGIIIFLIPTTFMMHNYWQVADPGLRMGEQINFKKNLALLGAALALLILATPWPFSLM